VHDEIDLPVGVVRVKQEGGHGGHNGLRDLISHLGDRDFRRLRIGVGHPGHPDDVTDYVLQRPSKQDRIMIDDAIDAALAELPLIIKGDLEGAMQQLHSRE
jgi:PTH1 family peptidyl-tRNA hydrolase